MFYYPNRYNNDRFIVPFLGGALIGSAAVGLTRPRPIYNVGYPIYPPYRPVPYSNYNYNYYYPPYRPY